MSNIKKAAFLFKSTTNIVKTYLPSARNLAYLWLEGFTKDANFSHSFSDINKIEIPASQMRKIYWFWFWVNMSPYDIKG